MIPDEAVEAIHAAICEESLEGHMDPGWPGRCVKAAQAAVPHLTQPAYDDGYRKACEDIIAAKPTGKPAPYPRDLPERPKIEMALTLYMAGGPIDWICASTGISKAHLDQTRKLRHIPDRPQRADGTLRKSARQRDAT